MTENTTVTENNTTTAENNVTTTVGNSVTTTEIIKPEITKTESDGVDFLDPNAPPPGYR